MENEEKSLGIMINSATLELTKLSSNLEFENAQSLIESFILVEKQVKGHPRLVISESGVDSIRVDNIVRNFTFRDLVELASDVSSLLSEYIIFEILGGLLLLIYIYDQSKVKLSPMYFNQWLSMYS